MATDLVTVSPTYNGDSVLLTAGLIVRLAGANNNVVRAQSDSAAHVQGVNGVVISGSAAPTGAVLVVCTGRETIQMESGLTPAAGDTVYVSPTIAGKGTNVLPANVSAIGTIADISNYARLGTVEVDVNISAVTPASVSGVSSVSTQKPGDSVVPNVGAVVIEGGGWARAANITALATLGAANFPIGNSWCWVDSVGAWFSLQTSALTTTPTTVISASGLAGAQWLRQNWVNHTWEAQTAWFVNTSTGSDENAGTIGSPLLTVSEAARRLSFATLTAAVTVTVTGDMASTDRAVFTFFTGVSGSFTLTGTPTLLYTGTVSGTTAAGAAPTTGDNTLSDAAITGGSFTAAGAMATGVMFARTSGTAAQFFAVKDKGTQTVRITVPMSNFFTAAPALAPGDTYTFSQLPLLTMPRFPNAPAGGGANTTGSIQIKNWLSATTLRPYEMNCLLFVNCWLRGADLPGGAFAGQCLFTGNSQFTGSGGTFAGFCSSMAGGGVGTATVATSMLINGCVYFQMILGPAITIQSAQWQVSSGSYCEQNGPDVLAYDTASYVFLIDYGAKYLQKHSGAFGGNGNAELCNAGHGSWFMHTTTPYWLAGSSTDAATPILANGSAGISVATETAGGGVPNAFQNGVFPTS